MDNSPRRPIASRPYIPDYGIPATEEGMLPWSYVHERMQESLHYWISTTDPNGQPHATPVWGVWLEDVLFFDGSPNTRRGRDLAFNPKVSVHLEDGTQAIILEGEAQEMKEPSLDLRKLLAGAYSEKYTDRGYSPEPETWESGGLYLFRPQLVFAWTNFPVDTTRWRFED